MDQGELIDRVLAGDMTAARELYDAHVGAVYRLAKRITGVDDLAEEATQDAFVRVFRGLKRFRGDATLTTWIHQIALSAILTAMRGRRRWTARRAEIEEADHVAHVQRDAEPDLRERLYAAIDALPEIYKTVFVLHEIDGRNHDEIGALLGIPNGTSKARLSEARAKLRVALKEFEGEWARA